jgi:nucleoside-diphosphate-sugar epimerase
MRVFLTGATGFIGSRLVPELLAAGHSVLGLTRSDAGAKALTQAGAEPYRGTLEDPDSLGAGAAQADAVIHCAFDHDFSNFVANCEKDARAIRAMGEALKGSQKLMLITSGTGIGAPGPGQPATEDVFNPHHPNPRILSEKTGAELSAAGVKVAVMRLPQVHDTQRQGLVSPYVVIAKQRGVAAYIGEGRNRWPAAHVSDVVKLYRLAIEQGRPGERFHAVDEEVGVGSRGGRAFRLARAVRCDGHAGVERLDAAAARLAAAGPGPHRRPRTHGLFGVRLSAIDLRARAR